MIIEKVQKKFQVARKILMKNETFINKVIDICFIFVEMKRLSSLLMIAFLLFAVTWLQAGTLDMRKNSKADVGSVKLSKSVVNTGVNFMGSNINFVAPVMAIEKIDILVVPHAVYSFSKNYHSKKFISGYVAAKKIKAIKSPRDGLNYRWRQKV